MNRTKRRKMQKRREREIRRRAKGAYALLIGRGKRAYMSVCLRVARETQDAGPHAELKAMIRKLRANINAERCRAKRSAPAPAGREPEGRHGD